MVVMNDPVVDIQDLEFSYDGGRPALDGVSLSIAGGECVGLIGPNGAGKSTLLLHLNGILRGRGRLSVLGLPVAGANLKTIRARVGLVFQDPRQQLFLPCLAEDVAFGPLNAGMAPAEVMDRVRDILTRFGLEDAMERSPLHLSLGEQKKAALAAVLLTDPALLAFDEPQAGLDPASRREFIELLRALPQTKIIATHDLELVYELCDRVVVMDGGRIFADGPGAVILDNAALLQAHRLEQPLNLLLERRR
jgi:cobalt/nickel transport system ATP-binding protein